MGHMGSRLAPQPQPPHNVGKVLVNSTARPKPHYPGATGMRNSLTLTATFIANYCQTAIGLVYFRGNENKTSDFPPPTTSCLT